MFQVKPGRGPSLVGGIFGIAVGLVGVLWTVGAVAMGAPIIFPLAGVVFVGLSVVVVIYNFYNASAPNRLSAFDVTTDSEEPDPIGKAISRSGSGGYGRGEAAAKGGRKFPGEFCPFCGAKADRECHFCPKCGEDI